MMCLLQHQKKKERIFSTINVENNEDLESWMQEYLGFTIHAIKGGEQDNVILHYIKVVK